MSEYYEPPNEHYSDYDYERMAGNVVDWCALSKLSLQERIQCAKNFGPNWACVLSGMGDQ